MAKKNEIVTEKKPAAKKTTEKKTSEKKVTEKKTAEKKTAREAYHPPQHPVSFRQWNTL